MVARAFVVCFLAASSALAQSARRSVPVEVYEATIRELQAAMEQGRVTSAELVDAYRARIAAYDAQGPRLNAMIRLNPRAGAEAASLDEERRRGKVRGPLHGIPIILKDNFNTADLPTSGGSLALATLQPRTDAFVVRKLREAGAVVLGKTNLHELAAGITTVSSLGGQTRNPYDPARCPGGSSGGTGAGIAASFATVGWGSDTCGSIRIPAAFGSLFGLRPTQGLASRSGIIPLSHTQDIVGPLARTVTDLAIALDATIGADSTDPATHVLRDRPLPRFVDSLSTTALRGARLGVLTNYFAGTVGEIADTVRAAIRHMKALGAEVVDVTVTGFDSLIANASLSDLELKFDLMDFLAQQPGAPVSSMSEIRERGLYHAALENRFRIVDTLSERNGESRRKALAKQAAIHQRVLAILDSLKLDALVYPTMRQRPVLVGESQPGSTCELSAFTGFPALSMPAGFTADGLPVGVELMGHPFADARLVALAFAFEQSGARRRPPPTTPPLVNGRAPAPVAFTTTALASAGRARASFVFDPGRSELGYDLRVTGVAAERVQAVVLRRADTTRAGRVVARLSGPGMMRAAGKLPLSGIDRMALTDGRLVLALFTSGESGEAPLQARRPRAAASAPSRAP
jgi:Asp-tRNA(Asn)/Glu-tRNA(Gln) amidotransferase A subunit family amidase